jgi:hypothetical protein
MGKITIFTEKTPYMLYTTYNYILMNGKLIDEQLSTTGCKVKVIITKNRYIVFTYSPFDFYKCSEKNS